ncbi:AAA-like domain-containing protein [Aerosakkonemataceae cyanobacterium BLCC-F154]|uniref:AAA-like domain-containing protein n=1 Tax=Floridaenema fluviatile BLCC-F154 TaxID=3153640 RepID=A0ABV4YKA2_9CYAN
MTIYELVQLLNATQKKPLTSLQEWVLHQAWEGKTYSRMAAEGNYVDEYLRKTASELWALLSEFFGEAITKYNFRASLEPRRLTKAQQQLIRDFSFSNNSSSIEFPGAPLAIDSKFYIPRPPIEELVYEEITKPGSLVRIKAPRKMGKSSLVLRVVAHADSLNYRTVSIDFRQADRAVFDNIDKFLRWFSANLCRELELESRIDNYWDDEIGSKVSCTVYWQSYLLEQIQTPLVLVLNEVNRIFEYPEIAQEFLPLLRYWHEQAKYNEVWQKLRFVVVYSTEIYVPIQLSQSPFNIGLPLKLPPLTPEQVQELAQRYNLDWTDHGKTKRLITLLGGHPYLVQLAFYHLYRQDVEFKELLQQAATESGIYEEYLRCSLATVQAEPGLEVALQKVMKSEESVRLDPKLAYKLESIGLVNIDGDRVVPSCELYRLYFGKKVLHSPEKNVTNDAFNDNFTQLERENLELRRLQNIDDFTQLANRRYFEQYLEQQWQNLAKQTSPLSVIFCDIDFFKVYNKTQGQEAGDKCLQQISEVIRQLVRKSHDVVARYQEDEFGIILPNANANIACEVAQRIREKVVSLAINHDPKIGGLPAPVLTVSLGVASTIPKKNTSSNDLLRKAKEALAQAKNLGRNQINFHQL